jgi:hypothetical protein
MNVAGQPVEPGHITGTSPCGPPPPATLSTAGSGPGVAALAGPAPMARSPHLGTEPLIPLETLGTPSLSRQVSG